MPPDPLFERLGWLWCQRIVLRPEVGQSPRLSEPAIRGDNRPAMAEEAPTRSTDVEGRPFAGARSVNPARLIATYHESAVRHGEHTR